MTGNHARVRFVTLRAAVCISSAHIVFAGTASKPHTHQPDPELDDHAGGSMEFAYIAPGSFVMGRPIEAATIGAILGGPVDKLDDGPPRRVTLTQGYYLAKHKVTVAQYCAFLNEQPEAKQGEFVRLNRFARLQKRTDKYVPKRGVENASINTATWAGANEYCHWLSKKTGGNFRLPTEAEWEYAARGPEGRLHPWGVMGLSGPLHDYENLRDEKRYPHPWSADSVNAFPHNATPKGLARMVDFVGEWVSDYYAKYPKEDEVDPVGPKGPEAQEPNLEGSRVLRRCLRMLTERSAGDPTAGDGSGVYGFRVLLANDVARHNAHQGTREE